VGAWRAGRFGGGGLTCLLSSTMFLPAWKATDRERGGSRRLGTGGRDGTYGQVERRL